MSWYDPRDWFSAKARSSDYDLAGADSNVWDLPGYKNRASGLDEFANTRGGGEFREGQSALADILMGQATGKDSLSAEKLRQDTSRLQSQQQAFAASARPGQSALAARMASQQSGLIGQGMAGNAAMAGIAERQAAAQGLAGVLGSARGQDINAYLGAQQLGLGNAEAQQKGGLIREQLATQRYGADMQAPSWGEAALGFAGSAGGSAAMAGLMSDERAKKDVRSGRALADAFLQALEPKEFKYTDAARRDYPEITRPGKQLGVMAQNVERAAPAAVSGSPKTVDFGRMLPALAAAVGRLNQKVEGRDASGSRAVASAAGEPHSDLGRSRVVMPRGDNPLPARGSASVWPWQRGSVQPGALGRALGARPFGEVMPRAPQRPEGTRLYAVPGPSVQNLVDVVEKRQMFDEQPATMERGGRRVPYRRSRARGER